jgi:hypothetical protein
VECNIGPNTAPETFTFSNNLWYHVDDAGWPGPDLPVGDPDNIVGQDPLFENANNDDFTLREGSPAIGSGYDVENPVLDYSGIPFLNPRSIGAYEGGIVSGVQSNNNSTITCIKVWPNPAGSFLQIDIKDIKTENLILRLYSLTGQIVLQKEFPDNDEKNPFILPLVSLPNGIYFLHIKQGRNMKTEKVVILQ